MAGEMEKIVLLTTQHYDLPSVRVGKMFVSNIVAEFDSIRGWKCNVNHVIIFHTAILQRVRLITGSKNICARIGA